MYEKISEKDKRIEKVKKVKDKILTEIEDQLKKYKNVISEQCIPNDSYEFCVKESFVLYVLRDFLIKENCFMSYAREYKEKDIILYVVSDEDLSIWLQDNYSFVTNYLIKAEEADYCVFSFMSDRIITQVIQCLLDHFFISKDVARFTFHIQHHLMFLRMKLKHVHAVLRQDIERHAVHGPCAVIRCIQL